MIQGFSAVYGSEGLLSLSLSHTHTHTQAGAPLYLKRYENVLKTLGRGTVAPKSSPLGFFLREIWRLVNISSSVLPMCVTFTTMLGYGTSFSNGLRNEHQAFDSR